MRQPRHPVVRLLSMTILRTALLAALGLALSASPAASSGGGSARTVLDVADLEQGAPPAIAWAERRAGRTVIHGTDGTRTPVPNRLNEFAPMGTGHVVQTIGRRVATRWVGADGSPGRRTWRTGRRRTRPESRSSSSRTLRFTSTAGARSRG